MFFAKKTKGFCIEFGDHTVRAARMNQAAAPIVVEELREFAADDADSLNSWLKTTDGKGPTGLVHATCGTYPQKRIVRRHTLDLKRVKEPTYFTEIYSQQFRVEPDKYVFKPLNSDDGGDYDTTKAGNKEVLFCGLPSEEVDGAQDKLLDRGVYPERFELGTVATLGGLCHYQKFKDSKTPLLVLEFGADNTQSYILGADGVEISRPLGSGVASMIPIVQKELGLKDEESAKKLFYSNTFDFTSMGPTLTKKLLKELQSSIGFYEVQTGQSIGAVLCTQLPGTLGWLASAMAGALGVSLFKMELKPWLESMQITIPDSVTPNAPDENWIGLFSLMASYNPNGAVVPTDEKK
jgi:hypothetical protein